jgi:ABC-type dipeptide/oligopeptide/nickel transport system ATPase component
MIYNFRGTSGSGKSHLARMIMRGLEEEGAEKHEHFIDGRKQPYWTRYVRAAQDNKMHPSDVWVFLGHYNTACGGCDTISGLDEIFGLVKDFHRRGYNVVFEGLIVCSDANRIMQLAKDNRGEVKIIQLQTPREECLDGIRQRRAVRQGIHPEEVEPFKESVYRNVDAKIATCKRAMLRIGEVAPEACMWMGRDEAATYMRRALCWE